MHYFLAKIIQKLPYILQCVNLPPKRVPFNDPFVDNANHNKKHESTLGVLQGLIDIDSINVGVEKAIGQSMANVDAGGLLPYISKWNLFQKGIWVSLR